MARTSNRRWKGCAMCKAHKHAGNGDAVRMPTRELRKFGKASRVTRKSIPED